MPDNQTSPSVRGDPDMLARLRAWAEPLAGPIADVGPGGLADLQKIIEDFADETGLVPQYRKSNA